MTDIVERLRDAGVWYGKNIPEQVGVCNDAADEIERLRADIRFLEAFADAPDMKTGKNTRDELRDEITRLREANKELYDALKLSREYVATVWGTLRGAVGDDNLVKPDLDICDAALSKHKWELTSVKYGCHLEIDPDQEPDECVMDIGDNCGCAFAGALSREGKDKTHCEFWKPIKGEQK